MRMTILLLVLSAFGMALYSCGNGSTWQEAQQADTYEAYRSYITAHPEGEHVAEARKRADQRFWATIKSDTTAQSFQNYLDHFPKGAYRTEARAKLAEISSGGKLAAKARVTGSSVIIRSEPTTESPSVGVVAREGTIVQLLDRNSAGNSNQAILKRDITIRHNGSEIRLSKGKAVDILADRSDSVHVSFTASGYGSLEATISKDVIEAMSGQTWYKIHTRDDITGWIYGEFIEEL